MNRSFSLEAAQSLPYELRDRPGATTISKEKDMTETSRKQYRFRNMDVVLDRTTYRSSGTLAVIMNTMNEDDGYIMVTVNLSSPLQKGELAFVDTNNLSGIDSWLEENGIAEHTGVSAVSGFCTYPLMKFNI